MPILRWLLVYPALAAGAAPRSARTSTGCPGRFAAFREQVAAGWRAGNAAKAAEGFAGDAVYEETPGKQFHSGRADLFEFFGGEKGTERPMNVTRHHGVFDRIARWRESRFEFSAATRF